MNTFNIQDSGFLLLDAVSLISGSRRFKRTPVPSFWRVEDSKYSSWSPWPTHNDGTKFLLNVKCHYQRHSVTLQNTRISNYTAVELPDLLGETFLFPNNSKHGNAAIFWCSVRWIWQSISCQWTDMSRNTPINLVIIMHFLLYPVSLSAWSLT